MVREMGDWVVLVLVPVRRSVWTNTKKSTALPLLLKIVASTANDVQVDDEA